jgi:hypothetical protein
MAIRNKKEKNENLKVYMKFHQALGLSVAALSDML